MLQSQSDLDNLKWVRFYQVIISQEQIKMKFLIHTVNLYVNVCKIQSVIYNQQHILDQIVTVLEKI